MLCRRLCYFINKEKACVVLRVSYCDKHWCALCGVYNVCTVLKSLYCVLYVHCLHSVVCHVY
jgi:hypothetical protein